MLFANHRLQHGGTEWLGVKNQAWQGKQSRIVMLWQRYYRDIGKATPSDCMAMLQDGVHVRVCPWLYSNFIVHIFMCNRLILMFKQSHTKASPSNARCGVTTLKLTHVTERLKYD